MKTSTTRKIGHVLVVLTALSLFLFITGCGRQETRIGIVTRLESGSVFGSSEVNAALMFIENNPDCNFKIEKIDDKWQPETSKNEIQKHINKGTSFFILSNPSNVALASLELFRADSKSPVFSINTSATSNAMSNIDDYSFRIVPDVTIEQKSIANYVATLSGEIILIIQDAGNPPYTDPAFKTFSEETSKLGNKTIRHVRTVVANFEIDLLQQAFSEKYDILYILAGSYQQVIGNIAQLSFKFNPDAPIILTPWARSPTILQTAGPAAEKMVLPSQFPSRHSDARIGNFFSAFKKRFNYDPYSMSLCVYQSMELLSEAFKNNCQTPAEVKKFILERRAFKTSLGDLTFNEFGDTVSSYYFITDFRREFE